jgi:uncharacterized protein with PIN domain
MIGIALRRLIFPKIIRCEVCGRTLEFNSKDQNKSVHFDHRGGGTERIQCHPIEFLRGRFRNEESEKVWKECNFGMLCNYCNRCLPTKDRSEWLEKVTIYIKGK